MGCWVRLLACLSRMLPLGDASEVNQSKYWLLSKIKKTHVSLQFALYTNACGVVLSVPEL